MGHGQLRDGLRGRAGGVHDLDAGFLGIVHVDVVDADAAANDELQGRALGLINLRCADLGFGTDDTGIELPQGLAQLFGGVELLNDLMAFAAEQLHGGLIHAVGNENTHKNQISFVILGKLSSLIIARCSGNGTGF